ncbi:MAG: tetratricopeptide repeat protein [Spirochaetaceae bacterium]|jgi:tetratricopeptide (TPR) repeat protein|nr:tetratricopeptide repeat protein [Spirochaetaceae bacterium]
MGDYGRGKFSGTAAEGKEKFILAIKAGVNRDYKKAAALLEELLSEYDAPPDAYLYLGRSFHALKDHSRALAAFNDYLRINPHSGEGYFFVGRTYAALGMPHKAVPFLRKSLEYDPENPSILALLGITYLKSKHSAPAVEVLQRAVEIAPDNKRIYHGYLNALFIRGIRLCRLENYGLGIQMLRFVLENGSDSLLLRLELGRAARELNYLEEALNHYTQAIHFAPGDPMIRWYRTSILMILGRNGEALEEIEKIRSSQVEDEKVPNLPWNSELVDFFMIRSLLDAGAWRQAADSCRNWLKYRRADPLIHAMDAEALRNLGDRGAAKNHLERALELDPKQIQLWYTLIFTAWEDKDWKTLGWGLKNAKKLPGDRDLIKRFSVLYEAATNDDDPHIIETLQGAIRSLGPDPELMYALAERYLKTGLIEAALSWFKKVIDVRKDHEKSYLGATAALEVLSKEGSSKAREELKKTYKVYLKRWKDNYVIRREAALFLVKTGEFEQAARELELLLVWEPANPTLRRILAYSYRKSGRYREAAVFLKALLKEKPRDITLLLEYTGCLERAGAAFYAAAVLEKARNLFRKSPDIPLALGLLFYRARKTERALAFLREAATKNDAASRNDPRPYEWMAFIVREQGNVLGAYRYEEEAAKRKGR